MDKINMLIHIKSMQLEVFRRAIEVNQDDLNALVEERSSLLTQADIKHASKSLPTLPIETIAQIFSYLYWMEHLVSLSDNKTTLQRLLNDSGTTVNWRNVIQSQIPIQVSIVGAGAQFMTNGDSNLVGPHPKILLTHQLDGHSEALLKRPSTAIFATALEWANLTNYFENTCQFPWHNLVLSPCGYPVESPEKRTEIMKMFMLIYGRKLADLERLEFYPFHPYNGVVLDASPLAKDFDGHSIIAPKLRVVRVPLQLLPGLRPILSNITVLETSAVDHPEPLKTHIQVDTLLKMLEPYSNTLMSLTITDTNVSSIRKRRSVNIGETPSPTPVPKPRYRQFAFPRLKRLKLIYFAEYAVQDMVSAMDLPSLSHFSFTVAWDDQRDDGVSIALLHNSFPRLECLAMDLANITVRPTTHVGS